MQAEVPHRQPTPRPSGLRFRERVLLLALSLLTLLPGTFGVSLIDRDEGWYAQVSREMLAGGDWITPTYLGEPWIAKPPPLYWSMAGSFAVLGLNAFAARLPSVIATSLAVVLLGDLAARIYGRRAAWLTAITFLTAGLPMVAGRMALTDPLLLLCVAGAASSLWRWAVEAGGRGAPADSGANGRGGAAAATAAVFWLWVGLGVLAKGPAIVVFIGALGLALALQRETRARVLSLRLWMWLPLAVAIAAPWYWLVAQAAAGTFAEQFLGHEILRRFTEPPHGHVGPPGYYLLFSLAGLLPWSALAPGAVIEAWSARRTELRTRIMLLWLIVPWIFLEFVPGKLPHYILPCYLPLTLLMGRMWDVGLDRASTPDQRRVQYLWAAIPIVLALATLIAVASAGIPRNLWGALAAAALVIAGFAQTARYVHQNRLSASFACCAATTIAASAVVGLWLGPALESLRLSRQLAEAANAANPTGGPVLTCGYDEPSLFFYLRAPARPASVNEVRAKLVPEAAEPLGNSAPTDDSPATWIISDAFARDLALDLAKRGSRLEGINEAKVRTESVWVLPPTNDRRHP